MPFGLFHPECLFHVKRRPVADRPNSLFPCETRIVAAPKTKGSGGLFHVKQIHRSQPKTSFHVKHDEPFT